MGRPKLDFNPANKGGFYVTTDLHQAKDCAKSRNLPTINPFDIPDSEFSKLDVKNLEGATNERVDFVTKGRNNKLNHNSVSGSYVENPGAVKRGSKPAPKGTQHAVFSNKAADVFNKHKVGNVTCH